jgi:hypothetical protein
MADEKPHVICPDCWVDKGLILVENLPQFDQATRCCFCGLYTRSSYVLHVPDAEVPRHNGDLAWMAAAGFKPEEIMDPRAGDDVEVDPRVVQDQ